MNLTEIKILSNDLDQYLNTTDLTTKINYHSAATKFQEIMDKLLKKIIETLNNELTMKIDNIEILASGSVLKGSTAMGFIIEEIFTRIIKDSSINDKFIFPIETIDSAYDLKYNSNRIDLLCNLKVEKHGEIENGINNNKLSYNSGIVAGKILQKEYAENIDIPKLYLVSKIPYTIDLDNSKLLLLKNKISNIYLESFITTEIKSDNRNWSKEFNPLSGRLQMPTKSKLSNYSVNTIPEYKEIKDLIVHLANNLG